MPSPFPGMNPYLEQEGVWHSFHNHLCTLCVELLVPQVRPDFFVVTDDNVYVHEVYSEDLRLLGRPDVTVAQRIEPDAPAPGVATLEAPSEATIPLTEDIIHEPFVEIRDRKDRSLVTIIEFLSPTNKRRGRDREQFLPKRRQILASTTHYIEIDLIRRLPRLPVERMKSCDYYVLVSRAAQRPHVGVWPIGLRNQLPKFPVPLTDSRPDATLDLQEILQRAYDSGGYGDYIYDDNPDLGLNASDESWVRTMLSISAT